MIQLSSIPVENIESSTDWKQQLKNSRLTTQALLEHLGIENHPLSNSDAEELFELRVPPNYLAKIRPNTPDDPLLLQILPQDKEFSHHELFSSDPLKEAHFTAGKGLIHKYRNRVLFITSTTCAINCRYCFRRDFPYEQHRQSNADWQAAIEYIERKDEIDEVILSGGEPLLLTNDQLFGLINKIETIPHIKRIRIHTRMLTTIPARVDQEFLKSLQTVSKKLIIVTHCNHPREIGPEHRSLFSDLRQSGVHLLNQAVLLKSVNDSASTLAELSHTLFDVGILPYYLFLLDKVKGASHFDLPETEAIEIYKALQNSLPGYLLPKLSVEIPDRGAKTLIAP